MQIEHFAINVKQPRDMAAWYAEHLGLTIIRADEQPPYITFLADNNNETVLELYANPNGEFLAYGEMSVYTFHIAFAVPDIEAISGGLLDAGAMQKGDLVTFANGDVSAFYACPWGVTLQFIQRVKPLF